VGKRAETGGQVKCCKNEANTYVATRATPTPQTPPFHMSESLTCNDLRASHHHHHHHTFFICLLPIVYALRCIVWAWQTHENSTAQLKCVCFVCACSHFIHFASLLFCERWGCSGSPCGRLKTPNGPSESFSGSQRKFST